MDMMMDSVLAFTVKGQSTWSYIRLLYSEGAGPSTVCIGRRQSD